MIKLWEIFAIMIIHWIADFVLQSDEQAKGKSKYMKDLVSHTVLYSIFWIAPLMLYSTLSDIWHHFPLRDLHNVFDFVMVTFVLHTITDYFTSRLNAKLWLAEKRHSFFIAIGFDQILHYVQLFITFYIIYK